nr:hypothetical protein CFP56_08612 [Quercus suber]
MRSQTTNVTNYGVERPTRSEGHGRLIRYSWGWLVQLRNLKSLDGDLDMNKGALSFKPKQSMGEVVFWIGVKQTRAWSDLAPKWDTIAFKKASLQAMLAMLLSNLLLIAELLHLPLAYVKEFPE